MRISTSGGGYFLVVRFVPYYYSHKTIVHEFKRCSDIIVVATYKQLLPMNNTDLQISISIPTPIPISIFPYLYIPMYYYFLGTPK